MAFSPERLNFFKLATVVLDEFPVALRLGFAFLWNNLAATTPGTPMCDDSETVMNMFLDKEDDENGLAPTANKSYEECEIGSSPFTALFKPIHYYQNLAMPDRTGVVYDLDFQKSLSSLKLMRLSMHDECQSAAFCFAAFLRLLRDLYCHQSSTQKIEEDTFNSHMHLTKVAFTALGHDTTRIDEIEKLSQEDFPPARIQKLREKLKTGKVAAVKFKQIDKIEFELSICRRKLADVESGVKYFQPVFTHVMTSMEVLMTEMTALMADIAMQAESSKGPLYPYSGIPDMIPHFIGRQEESQAIMDHLTAGDTRLVDVWGPPGFGKTSVAINVAHHLRAMDIPVYLISLRGMKSKRELVSKLFSTFAVAKQKPHHVSAPHWLIHCLQQLHNRHVLILDNADDVLESGDAKLREEVLRFTEEILTQCSRIKLLFTTREPLDYLSHKLPIYHERVGVLDEVSSVNLVQSLLPNVSVDDCFSIVTVCGQVPLAMRLMCAIMREQHASLHKLLEELKNLPLVEVLDNASFSDDARLKRMIDKSFQRLTDQEKRAFVSLAAFPGCFGIADATTMLHLKTNRTTKKILRSLERKSLIESCVEDTETVFKVHPLLRGFVDEKKRTDQRIRACFYFAKLRFYYLKIKRFAKAFKKFLTGRLFGALSNYWKKGALSSLFNDRLFRRVVEVWYRAELFLTAVWHNSLRGRCTDTADCPVKLQCYRGIHQILCGDLDKAISSLSSSMDRLSSRGDQKVLKVLGYGVLAQAYQRKGQEELASHFQYLCSSEVRGTGLCTSPKIFNNLQHLSPVEDASVQSCSQQECLDFWSDPDLCRIPQAVICRKSPDTAETRAQVKKFHSCSILPNKKQTTNKSEERPLPIVKVHEEKTAEEQALALPFADQDLLRPQLCESQDVKVHLREDLQLEQASLENLEPETKDFGASEWQALPLPSSVKVALLSQSCDTKEIVHRLQEELQKEQSSLEHPDPETRKMIRCLARKAKCSSRLDGSDVVQRLREVTPAGTTGPLLPENLDVLDIPPELMRELSVNLCGGDEWIMVAERLGLKSAEIRFLDRRYHNPFEEAIYNWNRRNWKVGQLYDMLVDCELPIFADLL